MRRALFMHASLSGPTNLDVWKIEKILAEAGDQYIPGAGTFEDIPPENEELSDLPF
ncbi:MAG: hypothetical protein R6W81_12240 [Bacteroidales bacterium]